MKESIKILIEGEDRASAEINRAFQKTKESIGQIKQAGQQTKASTEFIGQLANQLGGSELGAFAGQLAQLTEKTSQFSEVAKLGGAGAMAFQAGLAALIATMGFQFGQFIGDAIFQTERWEKELADATARSAELNAELLKMTSQRFADSRFDIDLISDPDKKRAEYEKLLADLGTEAAGIENKIKQAADVIKNRDTFDEDANIFGMFGLTTSSEELVKIKNEEIASDKERLRLINEQAVALQKLLGERAKEREAIALQRQQEEADQKNLKALEDQLALQEQVNEQNIASQKIKENLKSLAREAIGEDDDLSTAQAVRNAGVFSFDEEGLNAREQLASQSASQYRAGEMFTGGDEIVRATEIMDEIEYTKLLQEIERELDQERKAAREELARKEKQAEDAHIRELDNLEQQIVLLRDGKEAAKALALEKQGIAKADAMRIVEMQRELEEQQKLGSMQAAGQNMAQESRVMVRGDVDMSPMKDTAKNTEESKKILDQMLQEIRNGGTKPLTRQELIEIVGMN